jgi:hypothetical protein
MLDEFQKAFEAGEFDKMIVEVEKKREANAVKLANARAKKKK